MKKIVLYLLCISIAGNMAFGAQSTTKNADVSLVGIGLPTIQIEDLDFGYYILGDPTPTYESGHISFRGGAAYGKVGLSVPRELILKNTSGTDTVAISMSLQNGTSSGLNVVNQVTLNAYGDGSSKITATIMKLPSTVGDYSAIAVVTAKYN